MWYHHNYKLFDKSFTPLEYIVIPLRSAQSKEDNFSPHLLMDACKQI